MRYAHYSKVEHPTYRLVVLTTHLDAPAIRKAYIDPEGLNPDHVLLLTLFQEPEKKKTSAKLIKQYIAEELAPALTNVGAEYLLCADADYFKVLTKMSTAEPHLGYVLDCVYGPWKVIYMPSHKMMFYDPEKTKLKIKTAMEGLRNHAGGAYKDPGSDIIHNAEYPMTMADIDLWLRRLHRYPALTCDAETFSLKPPTSGLGTLTFCWNQHEGIAFPIDFLAENERIVVRKALRDFFTDYKGKLIFHRATFDIHILIYQLFMEDLLDTEGLLHGLQVLTRDWDCSQIITYLATNSCARNELGLKVQAREFAGNYAVDEIKDITKVDLMELLKYNLIDGLSTWFVHDKHLPTMIADDQQEVYETIFKPAALDIIQMQLTGLPVNMKKVVEARKALEKDEAVALGAMNKLPLIAAYTNRLNAQWAIKKNQTLKIKRVTPADGREEFNPNSSDQLQDMLFQFLGLPIISKTESGLPGTDQDTLKSLKNHTTDADTLTLLDALLEYKAVNKILTSVIPAMEGAFECQGWHYLLGNFNLGGTLSGRLSSSDPNLQNLPATGTKYAKIIKECFEAPPGWLFVGLDFDSLEDKISALTTKDPNKLAVYMGHLVYEIDVDGVIHHIRDDSTIIYEGVSYRGDELYRKLVTNSQI